MTMTRVATNARERWALLITSDAGQDLGSRDRCIGLRVCLAATDDGTAEGFDLERVAAVEGITVAEIRAALRRLWRQHWLTGELDEHATSYDLELLVPWWSLDPGDLESGSSLPEPRSELDVELETFVSAGSEALQLEALTSQGETVPVPAEGKALQVVSA